MKTVKSKIKIALSILTFSLFFMPAYGLAVSAVCSNTNGSDSNADPNLVNQCVQSTPVWHDIEYIVNALAVGVGVIVTGVIIAGGVQYIVAGDSPQSLQAARQRITNGLIALFAFLFIYAFLQWLIPGGIFNTS